MKVTLDVGRVARKVLNPKCALCRAGVRRHGGRAEVKR